ncbi:MAG: metalloregulator ArsR/SmtB family transcription factor [Candidatus Sulfotelmatobacter sp.]
MKELESICKGLADTNRLRILNLLLHGELCVCDLQYVLASPQPNVSRHLTYLKNSGLVQDRRDGSRMCYSLSDPHEGVKRQLFGFLQAAFKNEEVFVEDSHKLKEAVEAGCCNASAWRPYSALTSSRGALVQRA